MLRLLLVFTAVAIVAIIAAIVIGRNGRSAIWRAYSEVRASYGNSLSDYERAAAAAEEEKKIRREPAQTDPGKWRALLQQLSDLALSDEDIRKELTADQIKKRWLGEPPATDAQIAAAEQWLGVRLPPSYRAFLKVSNGWHYPNSFVARLAGTEEIGFTRDIEPQLIEAWNEGYDTEEVEAASGREWPENHLAKTLMINVPSDYDYAANFMLNPETVRDGEMEAWFFSSWNPGADAHRSFWHLMSSQVIDWRFVQAAAARE